MNGYGAGGTGQQFSVGLSFAVSAGGHRHLFTIRLRGVQLRRFGEGFHRAFGGFTLHGKKAGEDGMSSFQALTTAIAAQVGTGNITGCATAVVSGGPRRPVLGVGVGLLRHGHHLRRGRAGPAL